MLNGNIFVSHLLRFILTVNQHIIQILPDIHLTALNLRTLPQGFLHTVDDRFFRNPHLFK